MRSKTELTAQEIVSIYFPNLDDRGRIPLNKLLYDGMRELISNLPDNALIPPERELAAALKVNRRTLAKILHIFMNNGALERSRKGTRVCRYKEEDVTGFDPEMAHPLMAPFSVKPPLRILLFDTLPHQKRVWQEIAENAPMPVQLEYVPRTCFSINSYIEFLKNNSFDIAQFNSLDIYIRKDLSSLFPPLSPEIRTILNGGDFRNQEYFTKDRPCPVNVFPLYFQFWEIWCHAKFIKEYEIDPSAPLDLDEVLRKYASKPVEGMFLTTHPLVWDLDMEGCEGGEMFEKYFRRLALLRDLSTSLCFSDLASNPFFPHTKSNYRCWENGELMLFPQQSLFSASALEHTRIPPVRLTLKREGIRKVVYSGLGILGNAFRNEAESFLQYLLTEEIQTLLREKLNVGTFRKERGSVDLWADCRDVTPAYKNESNWQILEITEKFLNGKITGKEAIERSIKAQNGSEKITYSI